MNHNCKTREKTVHMVCQLLTEENKPTRSEISKMSGASMMVIKNIAIGRTWTHISSKYGILHHEERKNGL